MLLVLNINLIEMGGHHHVQGDDDVGYKRAKQASFVVSHPAQQVDANRVVGLLRQGPHGPEFLVDDVAEADTAGSSRRQSQ